MASVHARTSARDILAIVPLVMRTVAAELRAAGELPAPAHFGLLTMLATKPAAPTLTELAALHGVSLPTMSTTVSAMVERGWIRRTAPGRDRRVVHIEVTPKGRATVRRVGRSAEAHLAELLDPLDHATRERLQAGLEVLMRLFSKERPGHIHPGRSGVRRARASRFPKHRAVP